MRKAAWTEDRDRYSSLCEPTLGLDTFRDRKEPRGCERCAGRHVAKLLSSRCVGAIPQVSEGNEERSQAQTDKNDCSSYHDHRTLDNRLRVLSETDARTVRK